MKKLDLQAMFNKIIFIFLFSIFSSFANACSGPSYSGKEAFDNASRIIRVKIISTQLVEEENEGETQEVVNAKYELLEVYKGSVDKSGVLKTAPFSPGNCMLPLLTGSEYVIYLEDSDFVFNYNGSWSYLNTENKTTATELNNLREYSKTVP